MSNALEFILKLQDMFSPGMRQAAQISNSASAQIESQFARIQGSGKRLHASVDELRSRLEAINRVRFSTTIEREFNTATRAANRLERQIEKMEGRSRGGGFGIGGLMATVGAYGAIKGTLGAAAEREQQRISFGVMTGSQKAGDNMLGDIVKMGAKTPFENDDLINAAQTMKLFGIENKNILPNLQMLGDVAGGNAEKLQSLSLAFSQVQSAGRLQGQDLLQLINAGFNPLQEISKSTGVSMADLKTKMEKGAISADMVTKAFRQATGPGGQFYMMMEKQSQTLAGRWSTFMDNAKAKLLALGEILMPIAGKALDFASALLQGEGPAIAIAIAIGGITASLYGATIATNALSVATGIWNAITNANPIVLIISLVIGLGVWLYSLAIKYEGWGKSMTGLWEVIKGFVNLNIVAWKNLGENIWYWIQYAWLKVEGFVQWIGGAMNNVFNALKLASEFKFGEARAALTATITTKASGEISALEKQHGISQGLNQGEAVKAMNQMAAGYGMIGLKKIAGAKAGVDPTTASAAAAGGGAASFGNLGGGGGGGAKDKADGINSGGQRSIVINIGKQIEKLEVHVMDAKEGVNEIEAMVRESMRRVMYSLNGVGA